MRPVIVVWSPQMKEAEEYAERIGQVDPIQYHLTDQSIEELIAAIKAKDFELIEDILVSAERSSMHPWCVPLVVFAIELSMKNVPQPIRSATPSMLGLDIKWDDD